MKQKQEQKPMIEAYIDDLNANLDLIPEISQTTRDLVIETVKLAHRIGYIDGQEAFLKQLATKDKEKNGKVQGIIRC
jgi:predicted ester cyclase